MEVALDLALQAAPDHPWVTEHPEWFTTRPDGIDRVRGEPAEEVPGHLPAELRQRPRRASTPRCCGSSGYWVEHGVRVFRVDNPHTKPLNFWHWLIWEVKKTDPDVLFLAEAFTRPAMMHTLARIGFTQSYTYFTWRTAKWELEEYGRELVGRGRLHAAELLRQHARHPAREPADTAGRRCSRSGPCWPR